MKSFKDAHAGVQPTIDTTMNKHRQEQYDLNCNRLDAIIDCIVLCGKQNIALRGHRDANSQLQAQSSNQGNFKAILQFRALGDKTLQKHLTDATVYMPRYTKRNNFNLQAFDLGQIVKASGRKWGVFCHL